MKMDSSRQQQYFDWNNQSFQELPTKDDILRVSGPKIEIDQVLLLICADKKSVVRRAALDSKTCMGLTSLLVSTQVIDDIESISSLLESTGNSKILLILDFEHFNKIELLKFISKNHKAKIDRLHVFTNHTNYLQRNKELAKVLSNFPNKSVKLKGVNTPDNRFIAFFTAANDIKNALLK